jgi:hypothetical protein
LRTASPTLHSEEMPSQKKCAQCGMIFPNDEALSKHKTRFCIGVKDSGIGRKFNHSNNEYNAPYYSNDRPSSRRAAKYQSQIDKVTFNLYIRLFRNKRLSFENIHYIRIAVFYLSDCSQDKEG